MSAKRAIFVAPFDELVDPRVVAELAAATEARGWDGFFVWDHVAFAPPVRAVADPWVTLAAIACAPQHRYIVRTIDPPDADIGPALHRLILARGPFGVVEEIALMRDEGIDVLVTKNSGGAATAAKIEAARALGIEVVMVERPAPEDVPCFHAVDDLLAWMETHRTAP